jgi:hypothetical protein
MSTLLEIFKTMEYGPAPESPDAVKAWLDEHNRKFGLFINNEWVTPKGAKYYPSYDPSNGELLAETVQAGKKEAIRRLRRRGGVRNMEQDSRRDSCALSVCDCAQPSETFALAGGA